MIGNLERYENSLNSDSSTFSEHMSELNKLSVIDTFRKMKFLLSTLFPKGNLRLKRLSHLSLGAISSSKDTSAHTIAFAFQEFATTSYTVQIEVDNEYAS